MLRGAAAAPHVLCAYLRDSGTARHEEFDPFSCRAARRQELARAGEECLPGCTPTHWHPSADGPFWCAAADAASAATARACADEKRPFRGGDLRGMSAAWAALRATMAEADCVAGELAKHTCTFFNEVVLDASGFPQIVEALFTHAPGSVFDRRARPPPPPPARRLRTTPARARARRLRALHARTRRAARQLNYCITRGRYARAAHASFLAHFRLSAAEVPLLLLSPEDGWTPFSLAVPECDAGGGST